MPMIPTKASRRIAFLEIVEFCRDTFSAYPGRFLLTSLSMLVGTASVILVVAVGSAGKNYVVRQIESIGVNWVFAEYEGGAQGSAGSPDPLTVQDFDAIMRDVPGISAGSPILELDYPMPLGYRQYRTLRILGVLPAYAQVRSLITMSGRMFDPEDSRARSKVAVLTEQLADQLYGSPSSALGRVIKVGELPFTVIGTFREKVETFGQSEVTEATVLIPYTVARLFTTSDRVKQLYFSVSDSGLIVPVTQRMRTVIKARHRPESVYLVNNLTKLTTLATRSADALTLVLLLIATVTLWVSGVGIMNIMLATVRERTREIGIRKALGATHREIYVQFLAEALFISLIGGAAGIIIGLALPYSIRFLTQYELPVSGVSALIGLAASAITGVAFGTLPAIRAARMDPVESLRYE